MATLTRAQQLAGWKLVNGVPMSPVQQKKAKYGKASVPSSTLAPTFSDYAKQRQSTGTTSPPSGYTLVNTLPNGSQVFKSPTGSWYVSSVPAKENYSDVFARWGATPRPGWLGMPGLGITRNPDGSYNKNLASNKSPEQINNYFASRYPSGSQKLVDSSSGTQRLIDYFKNLLQTKRNYWR